MYLFFFLQQQGTGEGSIPLVRKYLFLQNYMNTTVVLLADHGLENEQEQLRELVGQREVTKEWGN